MKRFFTRLWERWLEYTYDRACVRASFDEWFYGNGIMRRRWWGWQRIDPLDFYRKEGK